MRSESKSWRSFMRSRRRRMRTRRKKTRMKKRRKVKGMRIVRIIRKRKQDLRKKMISLKNQIITQKHPKHPKFQRCQQRKTMMKKRKKLKNQQRRQKQNQNLCPAWTLKMKETNQTRYQKLKPKNQSDLMMETTRQHNQRIKNPNPQTHSFFKSKHLSSNSTLWRPSLLKTFMRS